MSDRPIFRVQKSSVLPETVQEGVLYFIGPPEDTRLYLGQASNVATPIRAGDTFLRSFFVAAETIGGHRCVALDTDGRLILAGTNLERPTIGLIRDAVASADEVAVYFSGVVTGFSNLLPAQTYYLGASGVLTHTVPTTGVIQVIGVACTPTTLLVTVGEPVWV